MPVGFLILYKHVCLLKLMPEEVRGGSVIPTILQKPKHSEPKNIVKITNSNVQKS